MNVSTYFPLKIAIKFSKAQSRSMYKGLCLPNEFWGQIMASIYVLYWVNTDKNINLSDHLSVTGWARTDLLPGKAPGHHRPLWFCRYFFADQNTVHRTSLYCVRHEFFNITKNKNYAKITPFRNAPSKLKMCARPLTYFELDLTALHHQTVPKKLLK